MLIKSMTSCQANPRDYRKFLIQLLDLRAVMVAVLFLHKVMPLQQLNVE
jgi:hypothetical protein